MSDQSLGTRAVHAGERRLGGAAIPPIHQCTVFEIEEAEPDYDSIRYPRLNNTPNHEGLGAKLADLEGAEAALVTGSGMAAITTTLLHVLRDGGHLLVQGCLYGGTHAFVHRQLPAFGASVDTIDARNPASWDSQIRPGTTRAIYVESMTNPLLETIDHREVLRFARRHGILAIIDSTFASPANFRAAAFGYDIVLHSATKYLSGHSDLCAGVIAGSKERVTALTSFCNLLGGTLEPFGCFLLHRGVRTLELRVQRQNENALALARFLDAHLRVERVHYAGLPNHPDHPVAREIFDGFGGVLSFELSGPEGERPAAAHAVIEALRLPMHAPSLGGVESLVTRPATTSHATLTPAERSTLGIRDGLVRVALGIEGTADLCADFEQALAATR